MRESDKDLLKIEFCEKDGKDYFYLHVDRDKLRTIGFKAIDEFLAKLHILKAIGDFESAEKFFLHYSQVDDTMLRCRDIVIAHKVPRRIEL